MGPVINQNNLIKLKIILKLVKRRKLETGGGTDDSTGYFVEPTIFSGLQSADRIMQEEILDQS